MDGADWVLLDTETTGLKVPVYVVELAAQRMRGWDPDGAPFQRMLNHGLDIPPESSRVNGYTREILERDGHPPLEVYRDFSAYVGDRPLVAYNLSYDLDEVLRPEWKRLGIAPIGEAGFCALQLTQRLLDPVPAGNHKLQTLRQFYRLPQRGAHTALGDVETVVDLMRQVLRPLANEQGLTTWDSISAFAAAPWFPSRIAFGKFKGRPFREAQTDPDFFAWLEWLASASNPRSAEMGRWYLNQLRIEAELPTQQAIVIETVLSDCGELVRFHNLELETLRRLIASARERLAELEAEYTQERHGVDVIQSELFMLLRPYYERRDALRLKVQYRRKYLDTLLVEGEDEAEAVVPEYEDAKTETEQDYEEAAAQAADTHDLSEDDRQELKIIYRKLARLYHPDRFAHDPEKQPIFERLMQEVNQAKDRGDIAPLREIANDPNGFLLRQGLGTLDLSDDAELAKLRKLYDALQSRILDALAELERLHDSGEYELYQLSRERPEFVQEVADQHATEIGNEITELENEAAQLAEEIANLTDAGNPFAA